MTQPNGTRYFLGILIDITSIKQTADEYRRAHSILNQHIENTPLAVIEWDADFRLSRWNRKAEEIFGWTHEEVVGRNPEEWKLIYEEDEPHVREVMRQLIEQEKPCNDCLNRNYDKFGRVLICHWHNSVVRDAEGKVFSILSLTQDLTEQYRTRKELEISQNRLSTALEVTNIICWEFQASTGKTVTSGSWGKYFGLKDFPQDPTVEEQHLLFHPSDRERVLKLQTEQLETSNELLLEFRGVNDDELGRPRYFLAKGKIERDSSGKITRLIGMTFDISERKRAQEARDELDRQMMEMRHYESLGVLAGGLAHDFNNLMTIVLGNAALLKLNTKLDAPTQRYLREIEEAGHRAAILCQQMSAAAGIGRFVLSTVNLAHEVMKILPTLRDTLGSIQTLLHLPSDLPHIQIEPIQFRQIIFNLLSNSVEALQGRNGSIQLRLCHVMISPEDHINVIHPESGPYLQFTWSDDGCGMAPENLKQVWLPFFSTKFAGRGLGLAAVMGIMRGHRGGIHLESILNHGTTVHLYFPCSVAPKQHSDRTIQSLAQAEARITDSKADSATDQDHDFARGTILIVDDEQNIRELVASLVEEQDFRPQSTGVVREALEIARRTRLALAIVDLVLPGESGIELAHRLRSEQPGLPIIMISGYTDRTISQQLLESGPTAVLTKPFRFDQLQKAIEKILASA
jgi:PAS domain S-box-containing protein